jgi:hypothetical protein
VVELDDYSAGKLVFLEAIKAGYQKLLLSSVVSALKLDGRFLSGLHHCRQRIGMDVEIRVAESREDEEEQLRQALDDPTPTCFIGGRESLEPWLDEIGKKVPQLGLLDLNARRPDKALDVSGIDQCREEQARAAMELCLATPQPSAGARRDGRLVLIEPQWVSGRSLPNQERRHHALGRCRLFPDADHTTYAPLPLPSKSLRAHKAIARQALLHYPLPPLQPGKTYYHGIPFHIASSPREGEPRLLLIGADQYGNAFQRSSTIAVNRCVSSLYFLWAAGFCQAGRKLGALRVSFEDGSTSHHPIQPRKTTDLTLTPEEGDDEDSNMQDWWPQAPPLRNRHTHPVRLFHILRQTEHFGYYYVHRWENPHPGKVISRVRIQAETGASAFILLCGVTAGTLRSSK